MFASLNKYSLLHKSQSGFRQHHSCNTALINLIDRWLSSKDKGDIIGAVFFDLRKAFDVVDHDLLLQKLAAYKFSTTSQNWIRSYLTNRKSNVSLIKILDLHFRLSKVVCHKAQFLFLFCSYYL